MGNRVGGRRRIVGCRFGNVVELMRFADVVEDGLGFGVGIDAEVEGVVVDVEVGDDVVVVVGVGAGIGIFPDAFALQYMFGVQLLIHSHQSVSSSAPSSQPHPSASTQSHQHSHPSTQPPLSPSASAQRPLCASASTQLPLHKVKPKPPNPWDSEPFPHSGCFWSEYSIDEVRDGCSRSFVGNVARGSRS